jgi:20S proteasome alpha/beta subunit
MTTIAYRAGVLACDSCWSNQDAVDTLRRKIVRLKSGALLGQSGDNDARDVLKLLVGIKTERQLPSRSELQAIRCDFLGLLILPSGQMFKVATIFQSPENWNAEANADDIGVWEVEGKFAAVGSGAPFAIGAMEAGASARLAAQIACRRDLNSRPPVHTLTLLKA